MITLNVKAMPDPIFPQQPQAPVNPVVTEVPNTTVPLGGTNVVTPFPRKGFPKVLILGILLLILLSGILFLVFRGRTSAPTTSGQITWWGMWEDPATVAPLIAAYEQKNPKVKINYVKESQQDYRERLTNALAKGGGPDIFSFHNSWTPMFKSYLDPVPASVFSAADFAKTFYPVASADLTSGTGILGIPLEYDAITLFINTDIFKAAGANPPTTWDDLRSLAISLTKKDDQGNITQAGVSLGRTENVDNWQEILGLMMLQNGVDLSNPTGKLAEDALTFFTLFSKSDGVWDPTLPSSTQFFAGGKLAMYFAPSWRAFDLAQLNPGLNYSTVPVPQLPVSGSNPKNVEYATYWVQGVSAKSTNEAAAWDFLKFLSSSDSLSKMYQTASSQRKFGEPYPRVDMAPTLVDHPILGSIIKGAPNAQSWYLQSNTYDGPTGMNSLINKYFEDAVNAVNNGSTADQVLPTVAQGVSQVLKQYQIAK